VNEIRYCSRTCLAKGGRNSEGGPRLERRRSRSTATGALPAASTCDEENLSAPHLTPTPGQRNVGAITITFQVRSVIDLILPASAWRGPFFISDEITLIYPHPRHRGF
jgi:hypothetical protein